MNAHQRRKLRRGGDPRGYQVTVYGHVRMMDSEDPEIKLGTGQLYQNSQTNQLRVTIGGEWVDVRDTLEAKRKIQRYLYATRKK